MTRKERNRLNGRIRGIKILAFGTVMLVMGILGLVLFLRPEVSVLEKRELAKFPSFTWSEFLDGTWCKAVDTWYADTYPLREPMIAASQKMESLYGLRTEQLIESADVEETADEIPVEGEGTEGVAAKIEEDLPDGTVREIGEKRGKIYITGNAGYELYYFLEDANANFAATMNEIYDRVGDKVDLYVLVAPTSSGVMLDGSVIQAMGASDEQAAVDFINARLRPEVHGLDTVSILRKHNAEYVYFHTDHHWTALGAYYAYVAFCREKGIEPHDPATYETMEFPGFLGTFYSGSSQSPELAANPDTVVAYIPKGTNRMTMGYQDGSIVDWYIVNDVSGYAKSELYAAFTGGDRPWSIAHNETLHDGSAVLLIKDSFGNALLPWLVDHYEYIYWIDARYTSNTISQMVRDYNIQDVIYEASIYNASSAKMQSRYATIGQ
ncbi:MAG: hypothetical protein IKD79_03070 [Oscillospiraceae bacterium]|nr:hypothetical protein [Oscillospiraceae bacterium]